MKLITLVSLCLLAAGAHAQQAGADVAAGHKAAMARLAPLHGVWRGTAKGNMNGHAIDIVQTERIGPMLDGDVLVIEGRGYGDGNAPQFNAFAVVSYDARRKAYEFRSYNSGNAGTYPFTVTPQGYSWEIQAGPGLKIRYDITIRDGSWQETGYYLREGAAPEAFIQLDLKRVADSDWPAAGAISK